MGFLFTLKRSLVVKAPDLSSPKCLVVTNVLVCFLFVFFMRNLPFLYIIFSFGTWVFTSPISSSPPSSSLPRPLGVEPHFLLGKMQSVFFILFLFSPETFFGAGQRQHKGGDRAKFGVHITPHPNPGSTQHLPTHGRPPRQVRAIQKTKI